jgi:hypothetical protein
MRKLKRMPMFQVDRGQTFVLGGTRMHKVALYRKENGDAFTFDFMIMNRGNDATVFEIENCNESLCKELYEFSIEGETIDFAELKALAMLMGMRKEIAA